MITTEMKSNGTTVRIHDEFINDSSSRGCMSHLNQIVTDSYKRRIMEAQTAQTSNSDLPMPQ